MEKTDIIEINGRRYDVHSGKYAGVPVTPADPPQHRKAAAAEPKTKIRTGRQAAKHAHRHAPSGSKLLMRQAVKKPPSQRRLKAQGAVAKANPISPTYRKEIRLTRAKHTSQSHSINHFSAIKAVDYPVEEIAPSPLVIPPEPIVVRRVAPATHKTKRPQTTAELLEIALQSATAHEQPPLPRHRRRLLKPRNRILAKPHAA